MKFWSHDPKALKALLEAEQVEHRADVQDLRQSLSCARSRAARQAREILDYRERLANGDQWRADAEMKLANAQREIDRLNAQIQELMWR